MNRARSVSDFGCAVKWLLVAALALPCGAAEAETRVSLYAGGSGTHRSDIRLRLAQGELRFRGVAWDSRSFEMPIYYGLRVAHFLGPRPGVGLMLDFFHDKVYARSDAEGRLGGAIQGFNMSHGANYLTLSLLYRWAASERIEPYVGLGAGTMAPHVEATVAGQSAEGYQFPRGRVLQISAGVVYRFAWFLGGVLEYRFTHASVRVDVPGGDLSTRLSTHHIVGGAAVTLP